ncbi:hypothetical protein FQN54_002088 [Arachnomyces sp. PD_36]|nr:hypothetical protein FQN54_002088 [Arachnomyces sp. PD_36]
MVFGRGHASAEKETTRHPSARKPSVVLGHRLARSLLYLLAFIFLILVLTGSLSDRTLLRDAYFLKIDLSDIVPQSVPNATLLNSIARTIGLHDFYQVGLWNFCEGFIDEGITFCSKPKKLYFFNPVEILLNELLAGATIALPSDIMDALDIARIASHYMFGLFITGTVLTFLSIFLSPLAVSSHPPQSISSNPETNALTHPHRRRTFIFLRSLPLTIFSFFTALTTIVASAIATVMFMIFKNVFVENGQDLNISAEIGTRMLVYMWFASGCVLVAFIVQVASCCCACCGGRKARKALKANPHGNGTGAEMHEKQKANGSGGGGGLKSRFRWKKKGNSNANGGVDGGADV